MWNNIKNKLTLRWSSLYLYLWNSLQKQWGIGRRRLHLYLWNSLKKTWQNKLTLMWSSLHLYLWNSLQKKGGLGRRRPRDGQFYQPPDQFVLLFFIWITALIKGTVSWDRFDKFDKNLQDHWRPNKGTGWVLKFFRCFDDFIMQKVYSLWLMPVCVGLIMLAAYFCNSF
jgi:hypothetical protein